MVVQNVFIFSFAFIEPLLIIIKFTQHKTELTMLLSVAHKKKCLSLRARHTSFATYDNLSCFMHFDFGCFWFRFIFR